jgi:hypothetical protein
MGLKQYSFDNDYAEEKVDEGKYIIKNYKIDKIHELGLKEEDYSPINPNYQINDVEK